MADTRMAAFRMPPDLIDRLDRHAERMREASPGLKATRADALRVLLTKALAEAESEAVKAGSPGRPRR